MKIGHLSPKNVKRHLQEQRLEAAVRAREQLKRRRGVEDSGRKTEPLQAPKPSPESSGAPGKRCVRPWAPPRCNARQARQSREERDYARAQLPDLAVQTREFAARLERGEARVQERGRSPEL
jgi:hypothetical protein